MVDAVGGPARLHRSVKEMGQLRRLAGAHWDIEIGALTEYAAEWGGDALLFGGIPGYFEGFRVLCNPFGTLDRLHLLLGIPRGLTSIETLMEWRRRTHTFQGLPPVPRRGEPQPPFMENVQRGSNIDLYRVPAPRWHELDGGRYLGTGCAGLTRDPESGTLKAGTTVRRPAWARHRG